MTLVCTFTSPDGGSTFELQAYRDETAVAVRLLARDLKDAGWSIRLEEVTRTTIDL